ncbi:MAG: hypothetical protein NTV16_04355, partial [Actinobacteria bacterium]|nr:hypothetical protein [Actinomycetota bacterium]
MPGPPIIVNCICSTPSEVSKWRSTYEVAPSIENPPSEAVALEIFSILTVWPPLPVMVTKAPATDEASTVFVPSDTVCCTMPNSVISKTEIVGASVVVVVAGASVVVVVAGASVVV